MEILKTFGLNPYLTIAQIINFLILLYILKRYLYPPLFKVFKKREELVKESIEKAEASEKALEKAKEQEKEVIKKAKTTGDDIIKEAREQADEIIKQAEVTAKERADKMLKDAKTQIELETSEAQKQLNTYVLTLSMNLLKKTLTNVFTEKEQSEIIDKAMKEMQKLPN
ncbi:MAG TPA: F0F1 ATP synthase subunit B [Candidatus Saccharimonadales bacterium]|nr:F0F1 ATP synthase subunit B [Candidatus Saccharimonadales bacterium]